MRTLNLKCRPAMSVNRRSAAFTLVEMLVVVGIIGVLVGIVLPVTFSVRKKAARLRTQHDIEALVTGLNEYKNQNNEYPQTQTITPTPGLDGASVLCNALTGQVKNSKSGRTASPLINVENFNVSKTGLYPTINDENGMPYLYYPATVPAPVITASTPAAGGYARSDPLNGTAKALYFYSNCNNVFRGGSSVDWQVLLGDLDASGNIGLTEAPACTGPFLIWAAGADGQYGFDQDPTVATNHATSDDVTNFPIPPQFIR